MARGHLPVSTFLCVALALGCLNKNPGDDTQGATMASASTTGTHPSGSATSAPGSATDGTVSDSVPTTGGTTDEPCTFLDCDDVMPIADECDNYAQDCPEGQKCAAYVAGGASSWNALKCVAVTGTDEPGDPCTAEDPVTGVDSCIKGAMCFLINMDGVGTCLALCTGSPDAPICEGASLCQGELLNLCYPTCDPLLQDCPRAGDACYAITYSFTCAPDASGAAGQANDPCTSINGCDPGLTCESPSQVGMGCAPALIGCCTPFCKIPDEPCPNADQQCVQGFDLNPLPPNDPFLDVGYCGVPG